MTVPSPLCPLFAIRRWFVYLLACSGPFMAAQSADASLSVQLQEAKSLWVTSANREGASAKLEQIIAALAPHVASLNGEKKQILCESYNWLAVLQDRHPSTKAKSLQTLETLLATAPDFQVDKAITNARIQKQFDDLKKHRFGAVQLQLAPDKGMFLLDGSPLEPRPLLHLRPGAHTLIYQRPGFTSVSKSVEVKAGESLSLAFELQRTSSTLTFLVHPPGAEIRLDTRHVGNAQGQAGVKEQPLLLQSKLPLHHFSAPFTVSELTPGAHLLELRASGYQTRQLPISEALSQPLADHVLEPIVLAQSQALLSIDSSAPDGQLLVDGCPQGPLPVKGLRAGSGTHDVLVRYPMGIFQQTVELKENHHTVLHAKPLLRLAFLGLEGDDFAGRENLLKTLMNLDQHLKHMAYFKPAPGETPQTMQARLQSTQGAELTLLGRSLPNEGGVALVISTLQGESSSHAIQPLSEAPLKAFVEALNHMPPLWMPWLGMTLLDVPGEAHPIVIQASPTVQKAGVRLQQPVTYVNGQALVQAAHLSALLQAISSPTVTLTQTGSSCELPILRQILALPVNAKQMCYPALLMGLRLQATYANAEMAHLLRFQQAFCFMHFQRYDRALDLLRDTKLPGDEGICQGTIDYYIGVCLQNMGSHYRAEAIRAFTQALGYPRATLLGPDGPLITPLVQQILHGLTPSSLEKP